MTKYRATPLLNPNASFFLVAGDLAVDPFVAYAPAFTVTADTPDTALTILWDIGNKMRGDDHDHRYFLSVRSLSVGDGAILTDLTTGTETVWLVESEGWSQHLHRPTHLTEPDSPVAALAALAATGLAAPTVEKNR